MELQVEHLENHIAQLKVQVAPEQLEPALRKAARRLSRQLRIPGFRPGKAPYNVVVNMVGEQNLLQEALEDIGNDLYLEALKESEIDPYSAGELEDVKLENGLTLIFSVAKSPDVDLNDYRERLRLDFEEPEVTDEVVENALVRTHQTLGLTELVEREAQIGDKLTIRIKGVLDHPNDETHAEEDEHDHEHTLIDEENYSFVLQDVATRDFMPGFSEQLVGKAEGEEANFELSFPEDDDNEDLAGRTVSFEIMINSVEELTLPEMNDFMAELATNREQKTLDELRVRIREDIEKNLMDSAEQEFANEALDKLVEMAFINYPQAMVDNYVDDMLNELDQNIRRSAGMPLEDYLKVISKTEDELREEYQPRAVERLQRSLVLSELSNQEKLAVSQEDIDTEIEKQLETFGAGADFLREYFQSEERRNDIAIDMVTKRAIRRLIDISKGLNPEIEPPAEEAETAEDDPEAETASSAEDSEDIQA